MRILVISDYQDFQASRPEAELVCRLAASGIDLSLMGAHNPYKRQFQEYGVRLVDSHPKSKYDRQFIATIRSLIREHHIDLIFLFTSQAITNGIAAAIGTPVKVVLYRGYTGNIHWYDPTAYLKFLNPRVDKIICIAESIVEYLEGQLFFPKGKAITINKGHDPAWYEGHEAADLAEFGVPPNGLVIACMANARRFKGIRYLLQATQYLANLEDLHLLLIGRDMDSRALGRLHENSPIHSRIHLTGYRTDPLSILKACDMFVLPSIKGEAITKSLIEAMSMGLPPVITDIPGNRNLVIHDENGIKVPIKDPQALAVGIRRLYHDSDLRDQFGQKARLHIQTNFHIDRTVREMIDALREIAKQ